MRHYIYTKQSLHGSNRPPESDDESSENWQRKARAMRIRRERILKHRLREQLKH